MPCCAREVYQLIVRHACKVYSQHAVALDYDKARLEPYRRAWACPCRAGSLPMRSRGQPAGPLAPDATRCLSDRALRAAAGLTEQSARILPTGLPQDPGVAALKELGIWTGLHNRAVLYSPYMRAQGIRHSCSAAG